MKPTGQPPRTTLEMTQYLVALPWGYFSVEYNSCREIKKYQDQHEFQESVTRLSDEQDKKGEKYTYTYVYAYVSEYVYILEVYDFQTSNLTYASVF